jgi:hypothetical protein
MPQYLVDLFLGFYNFGKRFSRDLYTALKFRGREFDESLQLKYPTSIRALIWMAIVIGVISVIVVSLSMLSDFAFEKINLGEPRPTAPAPTITPLP